jgi:hypothetical protein
MAKLREMGPGVAKFREIGVCSGRWVSKFREMGG